MGVAALLRSCMASVWARSNETPRFVARVVEDLSANAAELVLEDTVEPTAHLMSDEWSTFMSVGQGFAAHDAVCHHRKDFVCGIVHVNSREGFSDRVRRTVVGVFHHISPDHANLYFNEIGFRWSQRTVAGQAVRQTRKGRTKIQTLWDRIRTALQLPAAFRSTVGRQIRRTHQGGIASNARLLPLLDKGGVRKTYFRVRDPG